MPKLPFIPWFPADWLAATTMLSPATRGIWFDILLVMWQQDRTDTISGPISELARAGRCDTAQMQTAIDELSRFKVANVVECYGVVTLTCRRFQRERKERVRAAKGMRVMRSLRKSYGDIPYSTFHNTENIAQDINTPRACAPERGEIGPAAIEDSDDKIIDRYVTPVIDFAMRHSGITDPNAGDDGNGGLATCKAMRGFPETIRDVLAIAERSGAICTEKQAESYLLSRQATNWVLRGGSPVRNVGADLKRFILTWQQNEADDAKRNAEKNADWKQRTGTLAGPPKFETNERGAKK